MKVTKSVTYLNETIIEYNFRKLIMSHHRVIQGALRSKVVKVFSLFSNDDAAVALLTKKNASFENS